MENPSRSLGAFDFLPMTTKIDGLIHPVSFFLEMLTSATASDVFDTMLAGPIKFLARFCISVIHYRVADQFLIPEHRDRSQD